MTPAQVDQYLTRNFILLDNFWPSETCDRVVHILERRCTPQKPWEWFPHDPADAFLWSLWTRPDIVRIAEACLGARDVLLAGAQFQGRWYGDGLDNEQRFHIDDSNNTLLVEPSTGPYRYLVLLNYWTDVDAGSGPTVFRDGDKERPLIVRKGTVLAYNLNLVHRGTRMTASGACRFASWFIFRPRDVQFAGQSYYGNQGEHPGMIQFLEQAGPRERELVGIPAPGHAFWTDETMDRVQARYPGWDMGPYRAALH